MKASLVISIIALLAGAAFAKKGMKIKFDDVPLYGTKEGSHILGILSEGEKIYLLEMGDVRSKIQTRIGVTGWVDNNSTEFAEIEKGTDYNLEQTETVLLDLELKQEEDFLLTACAE